MPMPPRPFTVHPIGVIRSPFTEPKQIPIQSRFDDAIEATIELEERYAPGLKDLDEFTHAFVLTYLHRSTTEKLVATPYLEDRPHGIFAIRSPHRPNHLGLSLVRLLGIDHEQARIRFTGVDMLDGTPVIDIKPYVHAFDSRPDAVCGWLEAHFESGALPRGRVPPRAILDNEPELGTGKEVNGEP